MKSLLRWTAVILLPVVALAVQWPDEYAVENITRAAPGSLLDQSPFGDWAVYSSPSMDLPVLGFGPPVAVEPRDPAHSSRQMVQAATGSRADFELRQMRSAGRRTYIHFREARDGVPVIGGRLDAVLNGRGQLMRWSLRDYAGWETAGHRRMTANAAADRLRSGERHDWGMERAFAAWFPDHERRVLRPVYWLRIAGAGPHERWEAIVDADLGEIVLEWSGIHFDQLSGTISGAFWREYNHDSTETGIHPHQGLTVNGLAATTNVYGFFSAEGGSSAACTTMLRGPYVEVTNEDAPPGRMVQSLNAPFAPLDWIWTPAAASRPELNLYYHTMYMHGWYKILDPDYSALDYPLPAVANVGNGYDNAYWNGYGTYYGSGSQYDNFAMYSDVIYHEYTHGVTDGIYPDGMLPYIGQSGALNEAWSDYFACTINGDPLMGDWLTGFPNSYFRNLESNMIFPQHWVGQVHADSPFISAPLWTIRQALGTSVSDALAHFARYALPETFFDYFVAVLETDDDDGDLSNGTPHDAVIYGAFGDHGIGPGDEPDFAVDDILLRADGQGQSVGDGDRFMEQGETAELVFTLRNAAPLYPPPATDVQISVTTQDPHLSIANGQQSVNLMPAGSAYEVQPVVLQFGVAAPDHWIVIDIDVVSNGGSVTFRHVLEFTLGTPRLVIVEDDAASDVERFVRTVVREQDKIFERVSLEAGESLPSYYYPSYGMVLWLSGNATGNILSEMDRAQLVAFMNNGNKIVLSGQNIVDNLAESAFMQDVLQVEMLPNAVNSHAVTAEQTPFMSGDWFLLTGSGGAANQTDAEQFEVTGSSQPVLRWGRNDTGTAAGVLFGDGNGLLLGFGIEAISGMAGSISRAGFMNNLYNWAGGLLGDVKDQPLAEMPTLYILGPAYPNPFNASTNISYSIPAHARADLLVYDVMGRLVQTIAVPSSSGSVQWVPQQASGIYFAQLRWEGGFTAPVKLLQIR